MIKFSHFGDDNTYHFEIGIKNIQFKSKCEIKKTDEKAILYFSTSDLQNKEEVLHIKQLDSFQEILNKSKIVPAHFKRIVKQELKKELER